MLSRKTVKLLVLSGIAVSTFVILAWLYDYGAPIGYEVIGTTIAGETVILGTDQLEVHLAYTPLYATANQWRILVNLAWQNVIALTAILTPLAFLGGWGYKFYKHFVQKKSIGNNTDPEGSPPTSPPFWPYKFKFWGA